VDAALLIAVSSAVLILQEHVVIAPRSRSTAASATLHPASSMRLPAWWPAT